MRASKKAVAAVTCLLASVLAEQSFVDSVDFSRSLHQMDGHPASEMFHANEPDVPIESEFP